MLGAKGHSSVLAASGLSACRPELEITEAVLIVDDEAALAILHQLWAIAVRLLAGRPEQFQFADRHRNIGQAHCRCRQAL